MSGKFDTGAYDVRGARGGNAPNIRTRSGNNIFSVDWSGSTLSLYVDDSNIKTFIIDHPVFSTKYLIHSTLEGPENGVYYRGIARLKPVKDGAPQQSEVEVVLPPYFEALTKTTDRTVQLTPILDEDSPVPSPLGSTAVVDGKFMVRGQGTQQFSWTVHAVRKDVDDVVVEPRKTDVLVQGNGPYKWYSIPPVNKVSNN